MNKIRPEKLAVQILIGAILFASLYPVSVYLYIVMLIILKTSLGVALIISYCLITTFSIWWLNYLVKRDGHFVLISICAATMLFFFPTLKSEKICYSYQKDGFLGISTRFENEITGTNSEEILYISSFGISAVATMFDRECHYGDEDGLSFPDLFGEYRGLLFFRNLPPTNFQVFHFVSVMVSGMMYVMILLVIRSKHKTTKHNEI